jgi:hypothetical protein
VKDETVARFVTVTENDLARARTDRRFRQTLLTSKLNELMDALNRHKRGMKPENKELGRQLREGAELAVKLADHIARLERERLAGDAA